MTLDQIIDHIVGYPQNRESRPGGEIHAELQSLKSSAVLAGNEKTAKELWCLQRAFAIQESFIEVFVQLKANKFFESWCYLEEIENSLAGLSRNLEFSENLYSLLFIQDAVAKFQSLFPYRKFISPELLIKRRTCSACGSTISPRSFCGHFPGKIYKGEMCVSKIEDLEFLAAAIVDDPVQKFRVLFPKGKDGKQIDDYNYGALKYLMRCLESPFDGWSVRWTTKQYPHSSVKSGRNDPCPCGTGEKYKKCCYLKPSVTEIDNGATGDIPAELPQFEAFLDILRNFTDEPVVLANRAKLVEKIIQRIEIKPDGFWIYYHVGKNHITGELAHSAGSRLFLCPKSKQRRAHEGPEKNSPIKSASEKYFMFLGSFTLKDGWGTRIRT